MKTPKRKSAKTNRRKERENMEQAFKVPSHERTKRGMKLNPEEIEEANKQKPFRIPSHETNAKKSSKKRSK